MKSAKWATYAGYREWFGNANIGYAQRDIKQLITSQRDAILASNTETSVNDAVLKRGAN